MASKVTVACPHCGSTSTHPVGVSHGSAPAYCNQCRNSFRIYMNNGNIDSVRKN